MISTTFSASYTASGDSSGTTSTEVPGVYHVALGGHPYMLDLKTQRFTHKTIDTLRPMFIQADTLGEKEINPEALWRASQNTWHKGAGQVHLDRTDSDPARFRSSKGVNIWERWQLTLLPGTTQKRSSVNTNLRMTVAGSRLYVGDGNTLAWTTDLTSFTTITGTPATAVTGLASDGYTVYTGYTSNGLWTASPAGGAATQYVTGTDTLTAVAYVRGRLMVAKGRSIYNIVAAAPAALPTALYDHPNTDFTWVGFAEGTGFIYAAGYSGDKTLIYRIGIQPDGTALTVPVQAGQLPDGEIVRGVGSYLGFILIGTDKGVRLAQPAANGDLEIGALLTTGTARCFEGQDRFVWFGWDNYDSTSTGLGRLDLSVFNDTAPAYASDLMVTGQGSVLDVATFLNKRVLAVSGLGFYSETAALVTSGTLDSGLITYDLPDDKVVFYLDVKHADPLHGTHAAYLSVDGGDFELVGQHMLSSPELTFAVPQRRGEAFEIRQELERGSDTTLGPTLTRVTLQANPAVDTGTFITLPILLEDPLQVLSGQQRKCDVAAELEYLKGLQSSGQQVAYQEAASTYTVTASGLEFAPTKLTGDGTAFAGTCFVRVKTV